METHDAIEILERDLAEIETQRELEVARFDTAAAAIEVALNALRNGSAPPRRIDQRPKLAAVRDAVSSAGTNKAREKDRTLARLLYENGVLNHDQIIRRSRGVFRTRGGVQACEVRLIKRGLAHRVDGPRAMTELTDKGKRAVEEAGLVEVTPEAPAEQAEAKPAPKPKKRRKIQRSKLSLDQVKSEILRIVGEAGRIRPARIKEQVFAQGASRFMFDKAMGELARGQRLVRIQVNQRKVEYALAQATGVPRSPDHVTINPGSASAEPPRIEWR